MKITLQNYEEYFVRFIDNELSGDERAEVSLFLKQNPGLEAELDAFSKDRTKFSDEEIARRLADGNDYGGAVIFGFATPDFDAVYKNNFDHPAGNCGDDSFPAG